MVNFVMQDKSWRVRYNVAAQMVPLCEALGPDLTRAELVPAYVKLLEDTEAEVRIAAAGKVAAFSKMLTPTLIVSQVVPRVKELANDSSQFVRAALAGVVLSGPHETTCPLLMCGRRCKHAAALGWCCKSPHVVPWFPSGASILAPTVDQHLLMMYLPCASSGVVMELAPQLGKQPTIEHLVPVFLNLLRDPYPDVRLNVISKLDQVRCTDEQAQYKPIEQSTCSY